MYSILADSTSGTGAGSMLGMILWLVVIFGVMYFIMIRPQKKEQKRKELMLSEVATGDTVLTTSGFYGTIIDIQDAEKDWKVGDIMEFDICYATIVYLTNCRNVNIAFV